MEGSQARRFCRSGNEEVRVFDRALMGSPLRGKLLIDPKRTTPRIEIRLQAE